MSTPQNKIKKLQNTFKKNLQDKMTKQNERYNEALSFIQELIKKNDKLTKQNEELEFKLGSPSKKRTKKKIRHTKSPSNSNQKKDFFENLEIASMFKEYNQILDNVLNLRDQISKKNYSKDIQNFLTRTKKEKEQLMEAIELIQGFISNELNPRKGITIKSNYTKLLTNLENILKGNNPGENLNMIQEYLASEGEGIFYSRDLGKIRKKIREVAKLFDIEDIGEYEISISGKRVSLKILEEKINDCELFSKEENPLI